MADWTDIAGFLVPLLILVAIYILKSRSKGRANPQIPSSAKVPALSSLPILSITATNILLDSNLRLRPSVRTLLQQLSRKACIYVIVIVDSISEMWAIRSQISHEFHNVIDDDHILYSQTPFGRASMARQLEVATHLDFDPEVIHQVSIFHNAVLIGRGATTPHAKAEAESLEQFVATGDRTIFPFLCI
jgi:hypothetical protein